DVCSSDLSPLDALLSLLPPVEGVGDLGHLRGDVGDLEQPRVGVAAGDDHVLVAGTVRQGLDDLVDVDPAPPEDVGELVEHIERVRLRGEAAPDLGPPLAGVGGMVLLGPRLAGPRPAGAHLVPLDGSPFAGLLVESAEGREGLLLTDPPLRGLDELEDPDRPPLVPAAQGEAEGGGRLALAGPPVDEDERGVATLARRESVVGGDGGLSLGHQAALLGGVVRSVTISTRPLAATCS